MSWKPNHAHEHASVEAVAIQLHTSSSVQRPAPWITLTKAMRDEYRRMALAFINEAQNGVEV
jgi:hypothetical protein